MNEVQQGQEYVNHRRAQGASDENIQQELFATGWSARQIQEALSVHPSAPSITPPAPKPEHKLSTPLIVLGVVLVLMLSVGAFAAVFLGGDSDQPEINTQQVTYKTVAYPNFELELPEDWGEDDAKLSGDYQDFLFYTPNFLVDGSEDQATTLGLNISKVGTGEDIGTELAKILAATEKVSSYTVNTTEDVDFGGSKGKLTEIRIVNDESPDNPVIAVLAITEYNDYFYTMTAQTKEESWSTNKDATYRAIKSLKPLTPES